MRMHTDRGVEPGVSVGQPKATLARRDVPARDKDPIDSGQAGTPEDQVDIAFESVGVEMAVAVDQGHRRIVLGSRRRFPGGGTCP
jgi:hypothetical protein